MIGVRFGRLVVIGKSAKKSRAKKHYYWCQCECGNLACVMGARLRSEHTKSCGCLQTESRIKHGKHKTKTYRIWAAMLSRCNNKADIRYQDYGGRGITVCERWHDFTNFLSDMGEKPEGFSIERTDNDGNYCPENCRWIPKGQQQHNKRARGYYWNKQNKKWSASISRNNKKHFLGHFISEKEASSAYQKAKRTF